MLISFPRFGVCPLSSRLSEKTCHAEIQLAQKAVSPCLACPSLADHQASASCLLRDGDGVGWGSWVKASLEGAFELKEEAGVTETLGWGSRRGPWGWSERHRENSGRAKGQGWPRGAAGGYGAVRGNLGTAGRSLRRPCSGCRQEGGLPPGCRFRLSHFPAHLFHSDFQESSLSSCMWYSAGHWQRVLISMDFLSALMGFFFHSNWGPFKCGSSKRVGFRPLRHVCIKHL